MPRPFFDKPSQWLRAAERARASAEKLYGYPDIQARMVEIEAKYEDLASRADRQDDLSENS